MKRLYEFLFLEHAKMIGNFGCMKDDEE